MNDNALGAPTEGLGQQVTFAFNPPSGVPGLQLDVPGDIQAGIRGAPTASIGGFRTQAVDVQTSKTLELLGRVGDGLLQRQMEKKRTENFVAGMQRAMQGEAVADIAKEQPWFSKLFGDSDVVEGARAYASYTTVQTQIAGMEDQMPELRKMEPQQAQQFFINSVNNNLTGDKTTDLLIMKNMTQALPSVMRRQAKEHYGYRQEQASAAEAAAFRSGASRLQAAASGLSAGTTTQEEFDGITTSFMQAIIPPVGRDIKNYKESLTTNLVNWAQDGSMHALNAVKKHGLFDALDADQRTAVERAVETGEGRLKAHYSFQWNDELAELRAQAELPAEGQTPAHIRTRIDALNARYRAETGSDRGLIEPEQRAGMLAGSAVAIRRAILSEDKKRIKAADEAGDSARKTSVILARAGEGTVATLVSGKAVSDADVNEAVLPVYLAMPPEEQVKLLVAQREDYTFSAIKDIRVGQIEKALLAEQYTPEVQAAFDQYRQLREANRFVADKYYGRFAAPLEGFFNDMNAGMSPAGSFKDRFVNDRKNPLDKAEMKIAVDAVTSEYNSFMPAWAGGQKLKPGAARRIVNSIATDAERMAASTGNLKEAVGRAYSAAKGRGLEVLGGYAWDNSKDQKPLSEYLTTQIGPEGETPVATDNVNNTFDYAISELLYGEQAILPDTASDTAVIRLPDQAGVPTFHVQAVVDGKVYNGKLSANDVYTLAAKRKAREDADPITGKRIGNKIVNPNPIRPEDTPKFEGLLGNLLN